MATWISGESFFSYLSDSYTHGLYAIWAYISGEALYFFTIGFFFAPRLAEFLGNLSIAEAMGDLYGKKVRIITAIAGCVGIVGLIAMQLKVAGLLFEYCFDVNGIYGIVIAGVIVTIYSAFGGIKSVTFTDLIQFITFSTVIPIMVYFIYSTLDINKITVDIFRSNPLFDYRQVFDFKQSKSLYYLSIVFIIAASGFGPPMFQRMAMAKNTMQIRKSFITAGITCVLLALMMSWTGILVVSSNPNLPHNEIVKYVLFNYSWIGLKGLSLAGIMAMVMSTADSYINSTSIMFVHDLCRPLNLKIVKNELAFSRLASLFIGTFSMLLALYSKGNLMQLLITCNMFYIPIVTVPFVMATLGFRSSGKAVIIGMSGGFITVIIWESFLKLESIDGIIPGTIANLVFLIGSHYLLRQRGGWIGIKDDTNLKL
ncbi:MAG: sodium:solute symporter family protein, partial [Janthinobacterium lividum]